MKLENTYFVTQIIAGLAVVASLIFVGMSVMQNTTAIRLSTAHNVMQAFLEQTRPYATDIELADIRLREIADGFDSLTPLEQLRYTVLSWGILRNWANIYYQYQGGSLDQEIWDSIHRQIIDRFSRESGIFRRVWSSSREDFPATFQLYIDDVILPASEVSR